MTHGRENADGEATVKNPRTRNDSLVIVTSAGHQVHRLALLFVVCFQDAFTISSCQNSDLICCLVCVVVFCVCVFICHFPVCSMCY